MIYFNVIRWQDQVEGIFKIIDPAQLAQLWGKNRNIPTMTYDNLSRSLRNYYKTKMMKKVLGQKQVYQFLFSDKNPPQMSTQLGYFMDQTNQLDKEILFRHGLDLIPQPTVPPRKTSQKKMAARGKQSRKETQETTGEIKNSVETELLQIELAKTEVLTIEPIFEPTIDIDIKEECEESPF